MSPNREPPPIPPEAEETRRVTTKEEWDQFHEDSLKGALDWYWKDSEKFERRTRSFLLVSLLASFLATIIAAFPETLISDTTYKDIGVAIIKWIVVFFASLSTLCVSLLVRYGIIQGYKMREAGRAEVFNLAQRAKIRLMNCKMTANERVVYMEWVVDCFLDIEKKYGGPTAIMDEAAKNS